MTEDELTELIAKAIVGDNDVLSEQSFVVDQDDGSILVDGYLKPRALAAIILSAVNADTLRQGIIDAAMEEFEDFFDPISGAGLELLQHERLELSRRIAERAMHHLFPTRV